MSEIWFHMTLAKFSFVGSKQDQVHGREGGEAEDDLDVERRVRGSNLRHRVRQRAFLQVQVSGHSVSQAAEAPHLLWPER